jgi:hypothetical protein
MNDDKKTEGHRVVDSWRVVEDYDLELSFPDGETMTGPLFRVCSLAYNREGQIIGGAIASVLLKDGSVLHFGKTPYSDGGPLLGIRVVRRAKYTGTDRRWPDSALEGAAVAYAPSPLPPDDGYGGYDE